MAQKLVTGEVRLSFPKLAEPVLSGKRKKPMYEAQLIFAPGADLSAEKAAVLDVAKEKFGEKAANLIKTGQLFTPFRTDIESRGYPEGSVFFTARSTIAPGLVYRSAAADGKPQTVEADKIEDVFYPGAYVRAIIMPYYFEFSEEGKIMKKGVTFSLLGLQKLREGPRLDNRVAAREVFDALPDLEPADLSDLGG